MRFSTVARAQVAVRSLGDEQQQRVRADVEGGQHFSSEACEAARRYGAGPQETEDTRPL